MKIIERSPIYMSRAGVPRKAFGMEGLLACFIPAAISRTAPAKPIPAPRELANTEPKDILSLSAKLRGTEMTAALSA